MLTIGRVVQQPPHVVMAVQLRKHPILEASRRPYACWTKDGSRSYCTKASSGIKAVFHEGYEHITRRQLIPALGNMILTQLKPEHVIKTEILKESKNPLISLPISLWLTLVVAFWP